MPWLKIMVWWVQTVSRYPKLILIGCFLLAVVSLNYTANHLLVNTDTADMISPELDWRKQYNEYRSQFPHIADNIVVVLKSKHRHYAPEVMEQAAARLVKRIEQQTQLVQSAFYATGNEYLKRHGLLYLSSTELEETVNRIARAQVLIANFAEDNSLAGVLEFTQKIVDYQLDRTQEYQQFSTSELIDPLLEIINQSFATSTNGHFAPSSWRRLLENVEHGAASSPIAIIDIKPKLDWNQLFPAQNLINKIRDIADAEGINKEYSLQLYITGEPAMAEEELRSVSKGTTWALIGSISMVIVILWIGLGSLRRMLMCLFTLIIGLLYTATYAALSVGELNLISIAFAVLYVGVGVDYAIHFVLAFRHQLTKAFALSIEGETFDAHKTQLISRALASAMKDVGNALLLCAVTTGAGFLAFVPTDFSGVSDLGIIAAGGVVISLVTSITVLPACLTLFDRLPNGARHLEVKSILYQYLQRTYQSLATLIEYKRKYCWLIIVFIALLFATQIPKSYFDANPINLREASGEAVSTYKLLQNHPDLAIGALVFFADDDKVQQKMLTKLENIRAVKQVISVDKFIPTDQETKLEQLDELALILGVEEVTAASKEINIVRTTKLIQSLVTRLNDFGENPTAMALRQSMQIWLETVSKDNTVENHVLLQKNLTSALQLTLEELIQQLTIGEVNDSTLPENLRQRWVAGNNIMRYEIIPAIDTNIPEQRTEFIRQVQLLLDDVTGEPIVYENAGKVVSGAFQQALLTALIIITIILIFALKNAKDVFMAIVPLVIAGVITCGLMGLIQIPFNFANVIALPVLLGVGVDNSIHLVSRLRTHRIDDDFVPLLTTHTSKAVIISTLTTIASFGNLAWSQHPGTSSMGTLLTIGMFVVLFCTLILVGGGSRVKN